MATRKMSPMEPETVALSYGGRQAKLPVIHGTEDEVGLDISKLRSELGWTQERRDREVQDIAEQMPWAYSGAAAAVDPGTISHS